VIFLFIYLFYFLSSLGGNFTKSKVKKNKRKRGRLEGKKGRQDKKEQN